MNALADKSSMEQTLVQSIVDAGSSHRLRPLFADKLDSAASWLQTNGLPGRKTERWKYTQITKLLPVLGTTARVISFDEAQANALSLAESSNRVVILNGRFDAGLSTFDQKNISVSALTSSDKSDETFASLTSRKETAFSAANLLTNDAPLILNVTDNAVVDDPIEILYVSSLEEQQQCVPRLLVHAGQFSRFTLIEHYVSIGGATTGLTNAVTELRLNESCQVRHWVLLRESKTQNHVANICSELARDATLEMFVFCEDGALTRNDINITFAEPGAHARLGGVTLARNQQHMDNHITLDHSAPHCTSDTLFRGIADDKARIVLNGRIHIHPGAKQTQADLQTNNLLLSATAEIDAKPELEIYTDDVKCSHGATIGQMDEEQHFYLRSRGLSQQDADFMLGYAFINELVMRINCDKVRASLQKEVAEFFNVGDAVKEVLGL